MEDDALALEPGLAETAALTVNDFDPVVGRQGFQDFAGEDVAAVGALVAVDARNVRLRVPVLDDFRELEDQLAL